MPTASQLPYVLLDSGPGLLIGVVGIVLALAMRVRHRGLLVCALLLLLAQSAAGAYLRLIVVPDAMSDLLNAAATLNSAYGVFGVLDKVLFAASWILIVVTALLNRAPAPERPAPYPAAPHGGPQDWTPGPAPAPGYGPHQGGAAAGRPPFPPGSGPDRDQGPGASAGPGLPDRPTRP